MKDFDPAALAQFTGTELYYRIAPKFLITDGVKYPAENAGCYWLLSVTLCSWALQIVLCWSPACLIRS